MAKRKKGIQLDAAKFVPPGNIEIHFADGMCGQWPLSALGIDCARLDLNTIAAAASGTGLEVTSIIGEVFCLDAASLRCAVDPAYADKLDEGLRSIEFSDDAELESLIDKNEPSTDWLKNRDRDLFG